MRAVGLVVEYNPFHNGHLHHLCESRRISGAEVTVAVMSGHFLQRGEPALCDKWRRTRMALAAGVDVVVELPLPWACNSAGQFGAGGVAALEGLGGVDALCFGSEVGVLAPLQRCAQLLHGQREQIDAGAAALLRDGLSYPAARAAVVAAQDAEAGAVLSAPNNILGIAYLRALLAAGSAIQPLTVPRIGAGYHDLAPVGSVASASGIRRMLAAGETVAPFLPAAAMREVQTAQAAAELCDFALLWRLVVARLLRGTASLRDLYQAEAGLAERLAAAPGAAGDWEGLVSALKARQLTRTRSQRLLCHALLDLHRAPMTEALEAGPLYLHLLGASPAGEAFLAAHRKSRRLPLLGNYSRAAAVLLRRYGRGTEPGRLAAWQLEVEVRATGLYRLLQPRMEGLGCARDFSEAVLRWGSLEKSA